MNVAFILKRIIEKNSTLSPAILIDEEGVFEDYFKDLEEVKWMKNPSNITLTRQLADKNVQCIYLRKEIELSGLVASGKAKRLDITSEMLFNEVESIKGKIRGEILLSADQKKVLLSNFNNICNSLSYKDSIDDECVKREALEMFLFHLQKPAQINLVRFNTKEAEAGDIMFEKTFTGPIWKQVTDVLDYIKTNIIIEKTVKIQNEEKSVKCVNYPYNALEEAVVNAVFHKSYREYTPVEVRIYLDRIMIINFPGPDGYIDMEKFAAGKVRARKYRNRRIGEFFKEIDLSERQGTGIPKILRELSQNGSSEPLFETDGRRTYLETTIFIREGFDDSSKMFDKMSNKMSDKEKGRMSVIIAYIEEHHEISSGTAANLLDVEVKTASRLLSKAEKCGIVQGEGKHKTKKYLLPQD